MSKSYTENRHVGDVTIVKIFAPNKKLMDAQDLQHLCERFLFPLVEEDFLKKLAIDLSEIDYISSAARGKLISLYKKLAAVNGKLVTFGLTEVVLEVFQITKMDIILQTVADEQAALLEMAKEDFPKPIIVPVQSDPRQEIFNQLSETILRCARQLGQDPVVMLQEWIQKRA